MKLRPVVLVLLLLSAFYYLTTRGTAAGKMFPSLHEISADGPRTRLAELTGPMGQFELKEAAAAPAFDTEEQQNIAVYRRAINSVVNITSTAVAFDFFNRPVPQQGQGSGFVLDKQGHILTNNHVIDNAQRVEVTLADKHKYKATVVGVDKQHDLALLQITAPDLVPATLSESNGLVVGQRVYCDRKPVWAERHDDARNHLGDPVDWGAERVADRGCHSDGCGGEPGELGRAAVELAG